MLKTSKPNHKLRYAIRIRMTSLDNVVIKHVIQFSGSFTELEREISAQLKDTMREYPDARRVVISAWDNVFEHTVARLQHEATNHTAG